MRYARHTRTLLPFLPFDIAIFIYFIYSSSSTRDMFFPFMGGLLLLLRATVQGGSPPHPPVTKLGTPVRKPGGTGDRTRVLPSPDHRTDALPTAPLEPQPQSRNDNQFTFPKSFRPFPAFCSSDSVEADVALSESRSRNKRLLRNRVKIIYDIYKIIFPSYLSKKKCFLCSKGKQGFNEKLLALRRHQLC